MAIRLIARVGARELRHVLVSGEASIGADPGCDFVLGDPTVSRRHARVVMVDDQRLDLHDLDSRNGIEVGGRRLQLVQGLRPGDRFRVGDVEVAIEAADADDARPATPALAGPERGRQPAPAATVASASRQGIVGQVLPALLHAAATGLNSSELAARAITSLIEYGVIGASLQRGDDAVLARAGSTESQAVSRFFAADLSLHLWHDGNLSETTLAPLVRPVLDLLVVASAASTAVDDARDSRLPATAAVVPASADPVVRELYRQAAIVAGSRLNVLIEGESGTGKELFASYLHAAAGLPEHRFVALNCAALPRDLLDAELFGIEAGVATGVAARAGRFEQAHGGTLFLDEIADMAADTQARLLRVLQEGVVYRIGGDKPRPAQARVISACNRPLKALVDTGSFRLDLYHRIADWSAVLPPLRERPDDIMMLAGRFLERECRARGIGYAGISRAALDGLVGYEWPGNVRELEREMLRVALFLNDGEVVDSRLLKPEIRGARALGAAADGSLEQQLASHERRIIRAALSACDGNVIRAAERLGVGKSTLYRRLAALGLEA